MEKSIFEGTRCPAAAHGLVQSESASRPGMSPASETVRVHARRLAGGDALEARSRGFSVIARIRFRRGLQERR
jgi:hypothetical protein